MNRKVHVKLDPNLKRILSTHKSEISRWLAGGKQDLSDKVREKLLEHYSGSMPYGIQKARTGDPDQWIHNQLHKDLGHHLSIGIRHKTSNRLEAALAKLEERGEQVLAEEIKAVAKRKICPRCKVVHRKSTVICPKNPNYITGSELLRLQNRHAKEGTLKKPKGQLLKLFPLPSRRKDLAQEIVATDWLHRGFSPYKVDDFSVEKFGKKFLDLPARSRRVIIKEYSQWKAMQIQKEHDKRNKETMKSRV